MPVTRTNLRKRECDVVVCGGGAAGVAAAIGAAQAGADVLLIEKSSYLGGIATDSGVTSICGMYDRSAPPVQLVRGALQSVVRVLEELGHPPRLQINHRGYPLVFYDVEQLKRALEIACARSGAKILLTTTLVEAVTDGDMIRDILCFDGEGLFAVRAKAFVDATGDGCLAHLCGAETSFGEAGSVQNSTLVMWLAGVDTNRRYNPEDVHEALLKAQAAGHGPFTKMQCRVFITPGGSFVMLSLANHKLRGLDAESMTEAEIFCRQQNAAYVQALRAFLPGMENAVLVRSGPRIGIRQSRRIVGERTLTFEEAIGGCKPPDGIARGGWAFEVHGDLKSMSANDHVAGGGYYTIPIGCIKAKEVRNLWSSGRNISVDWKTHGSTRAIATCFATGQAAGVAAALTTGKDTYDVKAIQMELERQGALPT